VLPPTSLRQEGKTVQYPCHLCSEVFTLEGHLADHLAADHDNTDYLDALNDRDTEEDD
jgi:hypothetical protein